MKTVIIQGDGFAGFAHEALRGRTPLAAATTATLDHIMAKGVYGTLRLPGEGSILTGAVTHLALLGYDPQKYYSGPGSLVGAGLEVVLGPQDVGFIGAFVTLHATSDRADGKKLGAHMTLQDDTAGGIGTEEARDLIDAINEQLGSEAIQFYAGTGHRHLMVWVGGMSKMVCYDPHVAVGRDLAGFLPTGEGADVLMELMEASRIILRKHPVNAEREASGLLPANCLWLWGPGKSVELPQFQERVGLVGSTISSSDLHLGISRSVGWPSMGLEPRVDSSTNVWDQYAEATMKALQETSIVYLHIQEQPEMGTAYVKEKVARIEQWDRELLAALMERLPTFGAFRMLVVCNHWLGDQETEKHRPRTPFVLYESRNAHDQPAAGHFCEDGASGGSTKIATTFMEDFFSEATP